MEQVAAPIFTGCVILGRLQSKDMKITSRQSPKIKYLAKLKLKKYRDLERKMLIDGYYPLQFAMRNDYPIEELFICRELLRSKFDNKTLVDSIKTLGIPITEVEGYVFLKVSTAISPEGLMAVAPQKHTSLQQHQPVPKGIYVVAESIEKPGSLGAILRLADNVGATGVVLADMRVDMCEPEVIRSSLGTFFSVNILEDSTKNAIKWFKQNGIKILATSPGATVNYAKVDMRGSVAVVLGAEYAGLSEAWINNADVKIKIPMFGQANSLNVTAAAAVTLYEILRQRNRV